MMLDQGHLPGCESSSRSGDHYADAPGRADPKERLANGGGNHGGHGPPGKPWHLALAFWPLWCKTFPATWCRPVPGGAAFRSSCGRPLWPTAIAPKKFWLADSFEGFPQLDSALYPDDGHHEFNRYLAVSVDEVKVNFWRYRFLDKQVCFSKVMVQRYSSPCAGRTDCGVRVERRHVPVRDGGPE